MNGYIQQQACTSQRGGYRQYPQLPYISSRWHPSRDTLHPLIPLSNDCFRVRRIHSNIQIFKYIGHKYLFGHSFGPNFCLQIYSDICLYEYIRTSLRECAKTKRRIYSNIHTNFNTNISSDIRSCKILCTNVFGYSFV